MLEPSLNLQYFFVRFYEAVTGVHLDISSVPPAVFYVLGQLTLAGLTLGVVLLAFIVYVEIKLTIVEHEGFHAQEAEGYHDLEVTEVSSKNPRWERVMELASSGDENGWRRAILDADIMLGELLTSQGYRGSSIGEQLKDVNPLQFNTLDIAWQAHKMRNAIAHLGEAFPLSERDTQTTIDQYARVFEEFQII